MLLRSRRHRSICLLRSRVSSSRLGSICLLRSRVSSCRRTSSRSREALTRACHSSRPILVVSAVARSCAQQPIERPAVRLTVAIKKKLRFMPSIYLRCERAKAADRLDPPLSYHNLLHLGIIPIPKGLIICKPGFATLSWVHAAPTENHPRENAVVRRPSPAAGLLQRP